jgi:lectin-like protein
MKGAALFVVVLAGCEQVSGLGGLEFVPEKCTDPIEEACAGLACGDTTDACGEVVTCPDTCAPPFACQVGGVPPNTCGCTGAPNMTPPAPPGCTSATSPEGRTYYFCGTNDFEGAREFCTSFGTDLVIIRDDTENTFVYQSMGAKSFIGLWDPTSCTTMNCPFEWVDGSPPSFTKWAASEPSNNDGAEHCVELMKNDPDPARDFKWNDIPCSAIKAFVCETTCP